MKLLNYAINHWGFEDKRTISIAKVLDLLDNDSVGTAICFWLMVGCMALMFYIIAQY